MYAEFRKENKTFVLLIFYKQNDKMSACSKSKRRELPARLYGQCTHFYPFQTYVSIDVALI